MEHGIKGLCNSFSCGLCKINFSSHAEYVLHEFSKKHCDNLIKFSKSKPISLKSKKKNKEPHPEKEEPKVSIITQPRSIAKYGYFVPGEIYATPEVQKEFDINYDPYLQKFAENPFKETNVTLGNENLISSGCHGVTGFNKKKKKKTRTCQICNLTLATVPEYDAHMKSPQHIWKLKISGMGVSAHFVKASSDLQTTSANETLKSLNQPFEQSTPEVSGTKEASMVPFPLLYCSDCELLLNSPQQYNTHVAGKAHIECSQRKAELKAKKEKVLNPAPNQLYCYSCAVSLNNLFQYNEHKNGKKHLSKCRQLIKKGITIPPEERVPGLKSPRLPSNQPIIYPELYEKLVLEKEKQKKISNESLTLKTTSVILKNVNETNFCDICNLSFHTVSEYDSHFQINHNTLSPKNNNSNNSSEISLLGNQTLVKDKCSLGIQHVESQHVCDSESTQAQAKSLNLDSTDAQKEENTENVILVERDGFLNCSICNQRFFWQSEYDSHLNAEDHFRKILECKTKGISELEILKTTFSDSSYVKHNNLNKLSCSFCNITTTSDDEFYQHLKSVVHKYAFKDFKRKKTTEVYSISLPNEMNKYYCKLCKEDWLSLLDFVQHLNFMKHRSLQSTEKAKKVLSKKRSYLLQKPSHLYKLKRNKNLNFRSKDEKNPGVQTKITGVASDLLTGAEEPVSNLKALEPKIDPSKNISIGSQENRGKNARNKILNKKIILTKVTAQRQCPEILQPPPPCPNRPNSFFHSRPQYMKPCGQNLPPFRNWSPYPRPYVTRHSPYIQRPYTMNNSYSEPYWLQRPRHPRFFN